MCTAKRILLSIVFLLSVGFPYCLYAEYLNAGPTSNYGPKNKIASNANGQLLLIDVEGSSILISENGGDSWRSIDQDIQVFNGGLYTSIYPKMINDSSFVFLAINIDPLRIAYDIIATFDRCQTFVNRTIQTFPNPAIIFNENSFTVHSSNNNLWMIQSENHIYYSTNSGLTWSRSYSVPEYGADRNLQGIFRDKINLDTFYNLTSDYVSLEDNTRFSQVIRTTNSGGEWELLTPFIDTWVDFNSFYLRIYDFLPLSNGEFLALMYSSDTTDQDWEDENLVTFDSNGDFALRSGGNLQISSLCFEDYSIQGRIYGRVSGQTDVYVSNDFGLTWAPMLYNGIPEFNNVKNNIFSQAENDTTLYWSIEDIGLFKSEDHGANWEQVNTFEWSRFCNVYPRSDELIYSENGECWYSQDGLDAPLYPLGISSPDSSYQHIGINYANGDTIIGKVNVSPGNSLRLYRTFNHGQSWEIIDDLDHRSFKYFNDITQNNFYIVALNNEGMEISRDYGQSWEQLPNPYDVLNGNDIQLITCYENRFYISNYDSSLQSNRLWELDIDTHQWNDLRYPDSYFTTSDLLVYHDGVYTLSNITRQVLRYHEGQWDFVSRIPYDFGLFHNTKLIYNDPIGIICTSQHSNDIHYSNDGGYTWANHNFIAPGGIPVRFVNGFEQDIVRNRLWIETSIGLFWCNLDEFMNIEEREIELNPVDYDLFTSYPNPFNSSTRIQYNLVKSGNVKLDVYDITGRLVKTLKDSYQPSGMQSAFLDGTGLASGTYFIRLNTGREIRNRRITLIK